MSLHAAMTDACRDIGIHPPRHAPPGRWIRVPVEGKAPSNRSGAVLIFDDQRGGIAHNWTSGQQVRFTARGAENMRHDPEAERKRREAAARRERDRAEVARICQMILDRCTVANHPYLIAKGFPTEQRLVWDRAGLPETRMGSDIARALPEGSEPLLVVPGRSSAGLTTLQFIADDGAKKNILGGAMGGSSYRLGSGRQTWVCEGIATALTVQAALKMLGLSASVFCAFSAANVGQVAAAMPGSIIAADHDAPNENLSGMGAGEYYARRSGREWLMPPAIGDFNDMHAAEGLRAVALALREVAMR